MDQDLRNLEKQARATQSPEDIKKLQQARARSGLSVADAEYLQKYLKICEDFVGGSLKIGPRHDYEREEFQGDLSETATGQLDALNQDYQFLISEIVLRKEILANVLANCSDEGWAASDVCYG